MKWYWFGSLFLIGFVGAFAFIGYHNTKPTSLTLEKVESVPVTLPKAKPVFEVPGGTIYFFSVPGDAVYCYALVRNGITDQIACS